VQAQVAQDVPTPLLDWVMQHDTVFESKFLPSRRVHRRNRCGRLFNLHFRLFHRFRCSGMQERLAAIPLDYANHARCEQNHDLRLFRLFADSLFPHSPGSDCPKRRECAEGWKSWSLSEATQQNRLTFGNLDVVLDRLRVENKRRKAAVSDGPRRT
jgi:hypothetical protein